MNTTANGWKVVDEAAGVLCYEYTFRKGSTANAMTLRLADGSLALISAPCRVGDGVIKDLEPFGKIGALVASNAYHHLGLPEWHRAAPGASVYASSRALDRVARQQPGVGAVQPLSELAPRLAEGSEVLEVEGTRVGDVWAKAGSTWFVSDCFFSMPKAPPGVVGWMFKLTKSAPGFNLSGLHRMFFVNDRPGYKRWVLAQLDRSLPRTVVTSHGVIEASPSIGQEMRSQVEARL
jgi:hypothetical protein